MRTTDGEVDEREQIVCYAISTDELALMLSVVQEPISEVSTATKPVLYCKTEDGLKRVRTILIEVEDEEERPEVDDA